MLSVTWNTNPVRAGCPQEAGLGGAVVKGMFGFGLGRWGFMAGGTCWRTACSLVYFPQEHHSDDLKNPKESQLGFVREKEGC